MRVTFNMEMLHYPDIIKIVRIVNNIYQSINQEPIGDVLHSISHIDHQFFLVVNNSGKIIVIDDESFIKKFEIKDLISPRKIIKINNSKFYITDLYSNNISIYNRYDQTIIEIPVNGWCEDIILQNGKVFVCNVSNDQIYVINVNNDLIVDSIQLVKILYQLKKIQREIYGC